MLVVIGGGIVGVRTLRELSKHDLKCVLVEKHRTLLQVPRKFLQYQCYFTAGFDAPTGSLRQLLM